MTALLHGVALALLIASYSAMLAIVFDHFRRGGS